MNKLIIASLLLCSCETVRDRAATGVGVFVDCEAPNLRAAVAELVPLAKLAVLRLISGDGKIDTTKLRAAAAGMVGDLPRCALATAVAVMAAPAPSMGASVLAVPLFVPDPGALRLAFEAVRADWGGASYKTSAGTL
jgi:hypothetical protein